MAKSACWTITFVFISFTYICVRKAICQCPLGYEDVKGNVPGFLKWVQTVGPVPPGEVGPTTGAEGAADDCYYLARGGSDGDKALLLSPCYTPTMLSPTADVGLSFAYFLYGDNAGTLTVYWRPGCLNQPSDLPNEQLGNPISTIMDSQTNNWETTLKVIHRNTIEIESTFQIVFEATMKGETNNSIALDSISVENVTIVTTMQPDVETTTSPPSSSQKNAPNTFSAGTGVDVTSSSGLDNETTEVSNVTLNFCDANLIIDGLDNCTFIGLLFAIVPLSIVFLVWMVCCTYNRYCRSVGRPEGHMHGDAENSMGKDNYSSAGGYGYLNSYTDNTYVNTNISPGNTAMRGGTMPSDNHEMDTLLEHTGANRVEQRKERDTDSKKSSSSNVSGADINAGPIGEEFLEDDAHESTGDHPYHVLDGTAPSAEEPDHPYHVLDGTAPSAEEPDHPYDVLNASTSSAGMNEPVNNSPLSPSDASEHAPEENPEDVPYHVLEEPTSPTPPDSPRPDQNNSAVQNADEAYETVTVNNDKNVSLLSSPHVSVDVDTTNMVDSSDKQPYADYFVGQRDDNARVSSNSYDEIGYETVGKARTDDDGGGTENAAYDDGYDEPSVREIDDGYDRPTTPAVRAIGVTLVDGAGNEDTFL